MERTFAMIKPNSVKKNQIGRILSRIEEDGLRIAATKLVRLSQHEAEGFYAEHRERPFFGSLIKFMTSGPTLLMVLEGQDAVDRYRALMGATDPAKAAPTTLRKLFADSIEANSVHGSDSPASAAREISYFFSDDPLLSACSS